MIKKIIYLLILFLVGILDVLIYWNSHLYYTALKTKDLDKKIAILESGNKLPHLNDLIPYEIGKWYLDLGIVSFSDKEISSNFIDKAIRSFKQSIKLNPASQFRFYQIFLPFDQTKRLPSQESRI